ncbi:LysE family transporter [Neisseriaceae bacterium JH1-16]|nr:LysE family transporter [Neisseriaceae bacterium JH1-16]
MNELIAVAVITILAVISPGADFAMVTRNSTLYGRKAGLFAALGIAIGVLVHVGYTVLGVGLVISRAPLLFNAIKFVGAAYLVYIGYRTFATRSRLDVDLSGGAPISVFAALRSGFLTNALNPKTTLFVLSTYTQVVHVGTPFSTQIGYGLFMSFAHWAWFTLVALFFSHCRLRNAMLQGQVLLNRGIGTVLVGLGVALALAPMGH